MAKRPSRPQPTEAKTRSRTRVAPRASLAQAHDVGSSLAGRRAPTEHEIRIRAYELYLERGGANGADFDDWIRAENELRGWSA